MALTHLRIEGAVPHGNRSGAPVAAAAASVKKRRAELRPLSAGGVLTAEEKAIVKKERTYVETGVEPIINKCWSDDEFPFKLLPSFKELGLGDLGYEGYRCARGSQNLIGFVAMEIARVDAALCTLFGVLSGLAISSIYLDGSEGCHQCRVRKRSAVSTLPNHWLVQERAVGCPLPREPNSHQRGTRARRTVTPIRLQARGRLPSPNGEICSRRNRGRPPSKLRLTEMLLKTEAHQRVSFLKKPVC